MKNYLKKFIKNDFIICNIYLKLTLNFLYDPMLNLILESLNNKGFHWFFKSPKIIIYKNNISILDLLFLFEVKNLYILFFKLNKKFYYNITNSFFLFNDIITFSFTFYQIIFKFLNSFKIILKLKSQS